MCSLSSCWLWFSQSLSHSQKAACGHQARNPVLKCSQILRWQLQAIAARSLHHLMQCANHTQHPTNVRPVCLSARCLLFPKRPANQKMTMSMRSSSKRRRCQRGSGLSRLSRMLQRARANCLLSGCAGGRLCQLILRTCLYHGKTSSRACACLSRIALFRVAAGGIRRIRI